MTTAPTAHSLTIADLLLRDPEHPDVRQQLLALYRALGHEDKALVEQRRAVLAQRAVIADALGLSANQPSTDMLDRR